MHNWCVGGCVKGGFEGLKGNSNMGAEPLIHIWAGYVCGAEHAYATPECEKSKKLQQSLLLGYQVHISITSGWSHHHIDTSCFTQNCLHVQFFGLVNC